MGKDLNGKELGHGIIQKKNGRYEARYVDRFGKRRSVSGRDLRKVKRDYNEALYENDKETNIREKITLDQWYKKWMMLYKIGSIKESSKLKYQNLYRKHISPMLGKYYLMDIQQYQIKELIKMLKDSGLGYETQNKTKILLVDMFDKAMINEFVRKNPAKGISVKRDEEKDPRVQMTMDLYTSVMPKHLSDEMGKLDNELDKISRSGEDLIDSRYKKETKKDILDFPGNTVAV